MSVTTSNQKQYGVGSCVAVFGRIIQSRYGKPITIENQKRADLFDFNSFRLTL